MYELTLMTSSASLEAVLGDQIDCSSRPVRQPRWILKQLRTADLEVNADKFDILRISTECLEYLRVKDPRATRHRHNRKVTAQKE